MEYRNVDHFFFIDVQELEETSTGFSPQSSSFTNTSSNYGSPYLDVRYGPYLSPDQKYRITGRSANNGLQDELKKDFGEMPGPEKLKMKDYAVMNVAPSVIPTYFPGVRIFS